MKKIGVNILESLIEDSFSMHNIKPEKNYEEKDWQSFLQKLKHRETLEVPVRDNKSHKQNRDTENWKELFTKYPGESWRDGLVARAFVSLTEDLDPVPSIHMVGQLSVLPVPGGLISSCGLCKHQVPFGVHTCIHEKKSSFT